MPVRPGRWIDQLFDSRSLWLRWFFRLILFASITLPVFLIAAYSYYKNYQEQTRSVLRAKQSVAHLSAITMKERLDRLSDLGLSISKRQHLVDSLEAGEWEKAIGSLQSVLLDFPLVDRIFLSDMEGNEKSAYPRLSGGVGKNFSHRDWYKGVTRAWRPYISEAYKRQASPQYNVIAVAVPIDIQDSKSIGMAGILVLQIKLDSLLQWVNELALGPAEIVYVVDKAGRVAAHPHVSPQQELVDYSKTFFVRRVLENQRGAMAINERVIAYEPIPGYGWGVIVQQPARMAFVQRDASLNRLMYYYGVILVLNLMLALCVLYAIERVIDYRRRERAFLESVDEGILAVDRNFRVTLWNKAAERLSGWNRKEVLGKPFQDFIRFKEVSGETAEADFVEQCVTSGKVQQVEKDMVLVGRDGLERPVSNLAAPITGFDRHASGAVVVFRDITERWHRQEAQTRLITIIESSPDPIISSSPDGMILSWNAGAEALFGYTRDEILGQRETKLVPDDLLEEFRARWAELVLGQRVGHYETVRLLKDGTRLDMWLTSAPILDSQGRVVGVCSICRDITERKQAEMDLRRAHADLEERVRERTHQLAEANETLQEEIAERRKIEQQLLRNAFYDTLTGLPNRALFMERLGQALKHAKRRPEYSFAVLFIDIDRFKVINDSLGHMAGDKLLVAAAQRLSMLLRMVDTIARLGGDEFAILLDEVPDIKEATHVAERIQKGLGQPFNISNQELFITGSIGIALYDDNYKEPEELLRDADMAMYRAKSQGKARYEIFNTEMHRQVVSALRLESDLWRAIEHNEFILHYQPTVSLSTGKITGYEALVRWLHPERGLLAPGQFISLAEDTGLIVEIGRWVLRTACIQNRSWQKAGLAPLSVSVNLSGRQCHQRDLGSMISSTLQETGLDPQWLTLEITESIVMENVTQSTQLLQDLKKIGVKLALDDFGTGYSSLSYLKRFPFDTLKIDRSFINDIGKGADGEAILEAMVILGHKLGLSVIAEGVETREQQLFLAARGCDEMQGYLFDKPCPPDNFVKLLQTRKMLVL